MSKTSISYKGATNPQGLKDLLNNIITGLDKGTVYIQQGNEYVSLTPADAIELSLKAGQKKDKAKLSLELSWRLPMETASPEAMITISDKEPEIIEPEPEEEEAEDKEEDKKEAKDELKVMAKEAVSKKDETAKAPAGKAPAKAPAAKAPAKPAAKTTAKK